MARAPCVVTGRAVTVTRDTSEWCNAGNRKIAMTAPLSLTAAGGAHRAGAATAGAPMPRCRPFRRPVDAARAVCDPRAE